MRKQKHYWFLIIYLAFFMFFITNPYFKYLMNEILGVEYCKRLLESCKDSSPVLSCLGFTSGYTEGMTVMTLLLYTFKLISLPVAVLVIMLTGLIRIIYNMNTLMQVIGGFIIGIIYFYIYKLLQFKPTVFLVPIIVVFITVTIILLILEIKLSKPLPKWIDPMTINTINNKKNVSLISKYSHIIMAPYLDFQLYMSWEEIEKRMDKLIDKLGNRKFDCIVGIKSGGAIIAPYMANKMNLPCFTIKLSDKKYSCNKNVYGILDEIIVNGKQSDEEYQLCDDTTENIAGKRILLVDELISSGKTTLETIKYLMNKKKTLSVYPVCIVTNLNKYQYDFHYECTSNHPIIVWPWGYEN